LILAEGQPAPVIEHLLRSYKVDFPVRVRRPRDFAAKLSSLGNPRLPVSIVLDERGSIRAVLPASSRPSTRALRELLVRSIQ
jgi:hypothetical protein